MGVLSTAAGYYDAASTLPRLHKLESFIEIVRDQRARHLCRHQNLSVHRVFDEHDMKEIRNLWMNDHTSLMKEQRLEEYEKLLDSTHPGAKQGCYQTRESAFNACLFQVLGNKHIPMACIQYPVYESHELVPSWVPRFMQGWATERMPPDYQRRREVSLEFTWERSEQTQRRTRSAPRAHTCSDTSEGH